MIDKENGVATWEIRRIFTMCIAHILAFLHCFVEENLSSSIDSIKECDGDGHCYYKTQGNFAQTIASHILHWACFTLFGIQLWFV